MKYLSPIPKQFVDQNGLPLSNGAVHVYISGDTQYANVYQDADGEELMPNPARLDSNGAWLGFVTVGVPLDYVVEDKDGNVQFEYEKVVAAQGGSGSQVAIEPVLSSGTKIAECWVDGELLELFAPEGGGGGSISATLPIKITNNTITNNGANLTCSGNNSWAEGNSTKSTGDQSHAEGYSTEASANYTHAEGCYSKALQGSSHAEGFNTRANAVAAHAEGYESVASGNHSHAEGSGCTASGIASHAGGRGTMMSAQGGTAIGNFNSDDTALLVVGNGTGTNNRNDAFKVDSNGQSHITNDSGNLVKLRGAGIATFNVTQTDVSTYVYPNESDVRTAIGNYDDVILRLAPLGGGFANYILDHQAVAVGVGTTYIWVREDGSRVITLEGSGNPVVWTWTTGDSKLKLDVATLDTDIGKIGGSIAPAYDRTNTYAVGDLVMYARRLYECTTDISTPEAWDSSHWTRRSVSEFKPLFGALADGGALTDGVSVEVPNNKLSTLSTSQSALTLNVTPSSGTVPNFAVEITASVACTVAVTSTIGGTPTTLKYATAAGNELEASKTYQLTCVGSCWTLAEFTQPTP